MPGATWGMGGMVEGGHAGSDRVGHGEQAQACQGQRHQGEHAADAVGILVPEAGEPHLERALGRCVDQVHGGGDGQGCDHPAIRALPEGACDAYRHQQCEQVLGGGITQGERDEPQRRLPGVCEGRPGEVDDR